MTDPLPDPIPDPDELEADPLEPTPFEPGVTNPDADGWGHLPLAGDDDVLS